MAVNYYLGMEIDHSTPSIRWLTGMPYTWHYWRNQVGNLSLHPAGDPCLSKNEKGGMKRWFIDADEYYPKYLIIEWDV